jgi:glutathione S-transferase
MPEALRDLRTPCEQRLNLTSPIASHDIILHNSLPSPCAEQVRLVLGLKSARWYSVAAPTLMPRPHVARLTGGYQKIPVMQIGADVYCDSQCIVRELERRIPTPSIHPYGGAIGYIAMLWSGTPFLRSCLDTVAAVESASWPELIRKHNEWLYGRAIDSLRYEQVPLDLPQFVAQLDWLDTQLAGGNPFLLGDQPGLVDFAAYVTPWTAMARTSIREHVAAFPGVAQWMQRVQSIGHGAIRHISAADALALAQQCEPAQPAHEQHAAGVLDFEPGRKVKVNAVDFGRDPVVGTLVRATLQEVAIRREDEVLGSLVVHFPRVGYHVAVIDSGAN